jgi:hypothetical protein
VAYLSEEALAAVASWGGGGIWLSPVSVNPNQKDKRAKRDILPKSSARLEIAEH